MEFIGRRAGTTTAYLSQYKQFRLITMHQAVTLLAVLVLIACYYVTEMVLRDSLLTAMVKASPALILVASI